MIEGLAELLGQFAILVLDILSMLSRKKKRKKKNGFDGGSG